MLYKILKENTLEILYVCYDSQSFSEQHQVADISADELVVEFSVLEMISSFIF